MKISMSTVVAIIIGTGVFAIPLYLKSRAPGAVSDSSTEVPNAPTKPSKESPPINQESPRFVDLGTTTCAPCKVMLGVMEKLERKYPGAFIVEFVNVKENPAELKRYGVRVIPSQIFYGTDGQDLYRHTGIFRAEEVIAKWAELGFYFKPSTEK